MSSDKSENEREIRAWVGSVPMAYLLPVGLALDEVLRRRDPGAPMSAEELCKSVAELLLGLVRARASPRLSLLLTAE